MSKVWLITEGSRGIGRMLADAVLSAGGHVVAGAHETDRLAPLVARHGARLRPIEFDVTNEASIYGAVDSALTAFGRIDVVINNAVRFDSAPIGEITDADLRAQFEVNFFGLVSVAHAVLPVLREQGAGRFVQIVAREEGPVSGKAAHCATQAAIRSYFQALAKEVAVHGVEIDTVEPGEMLVKMLGRAGAKAACGSRADRERSVPGGKSSARVVKFSARPEAA